MAPRVFVTVPYELLDLANIAANHFEVFGYSVQVEPWDVAYPRTPTLLCMRPPLTLIVEVDSTADPARFADWANYARSCPTDVRVTVVVPSDVALTASDEAKLRALGLGVHAEVSGRLIERVPPMDVALNAQLPDLASLNPRVRKLLAPVYEKFNRSEWRDGFGSACEVVESEARRYLLDGLRRNRITLVSQKGKAITLTDAQVQRLTLGQLHTHFKYIQSPNQRDSIITPVLGAILKDRNGLRHEGKKAAVEAKLRTNVGKHMWRITGVLKVILNVK
jgi:hypothetical protein